MKIDTELCIACGQCVVYCPVSAIKETESGVLIDQDECVECGVCKRSGVCPTGALFQPEMEWPRILRALFSDPITVHPGTGVAGRGTEELKTNELTNRFVEGQIGFGVEIGRPNTGTTFGELEKITTRLAPLGVKFEPGNPVTQLIKDNGELIQDELKDERVLTAIIEFIVDEGDVLQVLDELKEVAEEIDTVFALDIIYRMGQKEPRCLDLIREHGYYLSPNGKVCIGIGRPVSEI